MNRSTVLKGFFFVDNIAPRTNVHRDDFSTVEGRARTAQVCAQTRDWFWFWMVEGRKEHTAPSILASYLFIPLVIFISLDFWKTPIVVSFSCVSVTVCCECWDSVCCVENFIFCCFFHFERCSCICGCPCVHVLQILDCVFHSAQQSWNCYVHYSKP